MSGEPDSSILTGKLRTNDLEPELVAPDSCVFCSIFHYKSKAHRIHETDQCIVILDRYPVVQGHALVIPRHHHTSILSLCREESIDLFDEVKETAMVIMQTLGAHGFNMGANTGKAAGQTVNHAHVHIIPRYNNDSFWCTRRPQSIPTGQERTDEEQEQLAQLLRDGFHKRTGMAKL